MTKAILFAILFLLSYNQNIFSEKSLDTLYLDEITVSARRAPTVYSEASRVIHVIEKKDIERLPAQSINCLLEHVPGIDIRHRGAIGVQSDISIRGGTFDQYQILINGIKINDPQTGHHNLNIPIDPIDIERIEVLSGPGSRIFGANAFSGAINIITVSKEDPSATASITAGEHGLFVGKATLSTGTENLNSYLSYNHKTSNGYMENTDFDIHNLFWHGNAKRGEFIFDAQAGYQNKAFGANSFYSVRFPEQFEHTRNTFASINAETNYNNLNISTSAYWRQHNDRFELFRNEKPEWYETHNYHQTNVYGSEINSKFNSDLGITTFGIEFRSENIKSNVLGYPTGDSLKVRGESEGWFTHAKNRNNIGVFAEHSFYFDNSILSTGAFCHYNKNYDFNWYPGIDYVYMFSKHFHWFASYNNSMRLPTFTELFYQAPDHEANPDIIPEKAASSETGIKFFHNFLTGQLGIFYRNAENIIDWVKEENDTIWQSKNITNIKTAGIETSANISLQNIFNRELPFKTVRLSYSYIDSDKNVESVISKYALDFLKHKFTAGIEYDIINDLSGFLNFRYNERNGEYIEFESGNIKPYKAFWLIDIKLQYQYSGLTIFAEATNIFDVDYVDFGNIYQPGRWLKTGLSYNFSF